MARMLGKRDKMISEDQFRGGRNKIERRNRRHSENQEWRREYSAMTMWAELNG